VYGDVENPQSADCVITLMYGDKEKGNTAV